jgi:hypothetical protein
VETAWELQQSRSAQKANNQRYENAYSLIGPPVLKIY